MSQDERIAILGGTGDQGLGLALRFTKGGRHVVIGSRKEERALEAAENVKQQVSGANVEGQGNADAATGAGIDHRHDSRMAPDCRVLEEAAAGWPPGDQCHP